MKYKPQKKVIILEKKHAYRDFLRSVVSKEGDLSFCFQNETSCLDNIFQIGADLIIVGPIEKHRVLRLINAFKAIDFNGPVIVITEEKGIQRYVANNGLRFVLLMSFRESLDSLVRTYHSARKQKETVRHDQNQPFIVGNHPEILSIKKSLADLSRTGESVLITGEIGTGKELIARAIHFNSHGSKGLFVKVNMSALSESKKNWRLIDFLQDAPRNWRGFGGDQQEQVKGTIYIDDVGEMPKPLQAELLLLAEGRSHSLLNDKLSGSLTFRIIAGTRRNVEHLVANGILRKDLYYRLNVFSLHIPTLRDRKDDIPMLADFFTYKYCKDFGKSYFDLSNNVKNIFMGYSWPGNVAELEDAIKRAVMVYDENKFLANFSQKPAVEVSKENGTWQKTMRSIDSFIDTRNYLKQIDSLSLRDICSDCLARIEKDIMKKALDDTNWNRKRAAGLLNISYKSMLNKIKAYELA